MMHGARRQTHAKKVGMGGFDRDIFFDPDSVAAYTCDICHDIILEAHDAMCGEGHLFCRSCLVSWLANHATCPTCRLDVSLQNIAPNHFVDRLVRQAKVTCDHKADGCQWRGMLSERKEHLQQCLLLSCPHAEMGCLKQLLLKDVEQHVQTCDFRPDMQLVECEFKDCHTRVRRMDLLGHQRECSFRPALQMVSCPFPGCQTQVRRMDLTQHYADGLHEHMLTLAQSISAIAQSLQFIRDKHVREDTYYAALKADLAARRQAILDEIARREAEDAKIMAEFEELNKLDKKPPCHRYRMCDGCRNYLPCSAAESRQRWQSAYDKLISELKLKYASIIPLRQPYPPFYYHPLVSRGMCKGCHAHEDIRGCWRLSLDSSDADFCCYPPKPGKYVLFEGLSTVNM